MAKILTALSKLSHEKRSKIQLSFAMAIMESIARINDIKIFALKEVNESMVYVAVNFSL